MSLLGIIATKCKWSAPVRGVRWRARSKLRVGAAADRSGAGPGANRAGGADDAAAGHRHEDDHYFATAGGDPADCDTEDGRGDAAGTAGGGHAGATTAAAEPHTGQYSAAIGAHERDAAAHVDHRKQFGDAEQPEHRDGHDPGDHASGGAHDQCAVEGDDADAPADEACDTEDAADRTGDAATTATAGQIEQKYKRGGQTVHQSADGNKNYNH